MKIPITAITLRHQKVIKQYDSFIELLEDRMNYKHEFKAEEPKDKEDLELGWEKVTNCFERTVKKDRVSCVDIEYIQATVQNKNEEDKWSVTVQCLGVGNDISIYFKDEQAARKFHSQITEWIFEANPPSKL